MKHLPTIAGALLGLLFVFASVAYFFTLVDAPPPPKDSAAALFMGAIYPTGFLDFVKVCELLGGILIAIPATRRIGLLVLGPIIINILAFHGFVAREGLFNPMIILIVVFTLFLVWAERRAFAAYIRGGVPRSA